MTPDIKLKDYYLKFVYDAKSDIREYKEELKKLNKEKQILYENIIKEKENILNTFNINLDDYKEEFINKIYKDNKLHNICFKIFVNDTNKQNNLLLQLIKYTNVLSNINKYNELIKLANNRSKITNKEYVNFIRKYYKYVHRILLEGKGYKCNKLGAIIISRWKVNKNNTNRFKKIDFVETEKNKKRLLEQGYKLYNQAEAEWYRVRNLPYKGIDYRVYRDTSFYYEFSIRKINNYKLDTHLILDMVDYTAKQYRGLSYTEIADRYCKTFDDIINLPVDLTVKLNIFTYMFPEKYLNFVRNEEQYKYKQNYSENR